MIAIDPRLAPRPGIAWGSYPERRSADRLLALGAPWRRAALAMIEPFDWPRSRLELHRAVAAARRIGARARELENLDEPALARERDKVRIALARGSIDESMRHSALSVVSAYALRTLSLRPYHHQLVAAVLMLDNRFVEMRTGEGKTLAAGITAAAAAMAGIPVHMMTANDYLVVRDEALIAPLLAALGLRSAVILADSDVSQRRLAYRADVVYATAKEVAFDYLRDRLVVDREHTDLQIRLRGIDKVDNSRAPMLRGLCMAILDEADSILLDEASTPLILSKALEESSTACDEIALCWELSRTLWRNRDFRVDPAQRQIELTARGVALLDASAAAGAASMDPRIRDELVRLALAATHVYTLERDYLVVEGTVRMVDEPTGRVAEGRSWSRGLQQLLEIKEGVPRSGRHESIAQITFQRFFPRYLRLTGMSGTLREARRELRSLYACPVRTVAPRRPSARRDLPDRCYLRAQDKWLATVAIARRAAQRGQPVLIGTDSVASSRHCAGLLERAGLAHRLLNAAHVEDEARIIADAGHPGAITVTTNIAGRGTDIRVADKALRTGGLLVIATSPNRERRIDRQLRGRSARQGEPGVSIGLYSLDDPILRERIPAPVLAGLARLGAGRRMLARPLGRAAVAFARRLEEALRRRMRKQLLLADAQRERMLSIAGAGE